MATLIKGLLSFNLDWQFVLVGVFISIVMEMCGVKALSFAVGLYLPLSTTLPIFAGGLIKGAADGLRKKKGEGEEDAELGKGSLFATGLVAGGALFGVIVAIATVFAEDFMKSLNMEHAISAVLGAGGFELLGVGAFAFMGYTLFRVAMKK